MLNTSTAPNSTHHADHWSVTTNGQGKIRVELHDDAGHEVRLTVGLAEALNMMEAIGRACKKARAEGQEG